LLQVYDASSSSGLSIQIHYTLPAWLHKHAGAPSRLVLLITSSTSKEQLSSKTMSSASSGYHDDTEQSVFMSSGNNDDSSLELSLVWVNKTATRIPEALWLRFGLDSNVGVQANSWTLHKMGSAISPHEVSRCGSVWSAERARGGGGGVAGGGVGLGFG
jgi:hypothetical protein